MNLRQILGIGSSRRRREHIRTDENARRSPQWHAWREKQKLHAQGRSIEWRPAPPHKPRRPDYDAKVSTRASRRRRDRARSLAEQ